MLPTGSGNLRSLVSALDEVGHSVASFQDEHDLARVKKVVIPGVGSFKLAMAHILLQGLLLRIKEYVESGGHVLGICIGMQLLAERGLEHGDQEGLGLVAGTVKPFRGNSLGGVLETHVGFNNLNIVKPESALLKSVSPADYFYFTHSFFLPAGSTPHIAAVANNGVDIAAVIDINNQIFGTQFHPEKSQGAGLRILENFVSA